MTRPVDPKLFLTVAKSALSTGDPDALVREVSKRWTPRALCPLLQHPDREVRRVSAVTLGFMGDRGVVGCLSAALRDSDELVNRMAEHGLWAIWFRLCSPAAAESFQRGVCLLGEEQYEQALRELESAAAIDPDFAEAHNQIAIAHYLTGRYRRSADACHATLARMPNHFGALAGLGHCYAQLGEYRQAVHAYERALQVNPHMQAIRDALMDLKQAMPQDTTLIEDPDPAHDAGDTAFFTRWA